MVEATGAPIADYFAALDDPRIDRTKRHKLLDIVSIAICGTICGADNWVDIELFGNCKEEWVRTFLELPNGIPSHDTFGDVFADFGDVFATLGDVFATFGDVSFGGSPSSHAPYMYFAA